MHGMVWWFWMALNAWRGMEGSGSSESESNCEFEGRGDWMGKGCGRAGREAEGFAGEREGESEYDSSKPESETASLTQ